MNVLAEHWEKLLLLIVVAVVAVVIVLALGGEQSAQAVSLSADDATNILAVRTEYDSVVASTGAELPSQRDSNPFTHDWLQRCTSCRRLHPRFAVTCPECGATVNYREDTDGDGMPNKWEQQYDLDWTSPVDGPQDADGDGISNADEYARQSDPTEASDPNLVTEEYRLLDVYRPARPILFKNSSTMQFNYKDRTSFAREGVIKNAQREVVYEVGPVVTREVGEWNPMINATSMVDRSEVELTDVATGATFTLVRGETNYEEYVEVKLAPRKGGDELVLREGETVPLAAVDGEATLTATQPDAKECVFTVGDVRYQVTTKQ